MSQANCILLIDCDKKLLTLYCKSTLEVTSYSVVTAANGLGEQKDSLCTPRGWHYIRAKIGTDKPIDSVFVGRRTSGEVFDQKSELNIDRDWILTRILWLCGMEKGYNLGGNVDTMRRYIYIHGTPDAAVNDGQGSHGCVRMLSGDIIDLFARVPMGCPVYIAQHISDDLDYYFNLHTKLANKVKVSL
jgi:L,D-transpeptidase YbiS